MGWNYRKSINLGGGLRLNFSKSGIGLSGGIKGFRISNGPRGTRLHASIPGTGIYYTKTLSGNKRRSSGSTSPRTSSTPARQYQYSQVVTNSYTGESRELRARTQWELNEMVRLEEQRQKVNENRRKAIEMAQDLRQRAGVMNEQMKNVRDAYNSVLQHTLNVNDRIDWDSEMINDEYPAFTFAEKAPVVNYRYKIGFWRSLFTKAERFEVPPIDDKNLKEYENRRNIALRDYLLKKADFDRVKNRKNGETLYLKNRFEESDKDAVERYISLVLTKSSYPADFEHDFDVIYKKESKTVIVNFLFQTVDEFPIVQNYSYNERSGEIEETLMDKESAMSFYAGVLYSVGVRTIHEIFESVYTDAVDTVCFNGYIASEEDHNQCAYTMKSDRKTFESIDLKHSSLGDIVSRFESSTISDFSSNDEVSAYI